MVSFVNSFLSYVMLMLVIIIVASFGFLLGLFLRKKKDYAIKMDVQEKSEE